MNTNEASLGRTTVQTYSSREKRAFDGVLFSMECTARWLENGCDPMQAASEIRLAMAELRNCIADCELVAEVRKHAVPDGWKLVPVKPTPEMELGTALEDAVPQQPAQSAEQDEPYGYAPANPNGNYFTRNKSTADYVGGMIPVYARAASAQSTAPQPALTDKRAHEMYEAAMSEMMRGGPYQSIEASTAAVVRALLAARMRND